MGTSVLTPTFRYHPGVIAQAFATLGVLYPGRVILGVGTGEALNEVTLGLDWPEAPERFQRMKEAIGLIEKLWADERVTFEGTYYSTPTPRSTTGRRPIRRCRSTSARPGRRLRASLGGSRTGTSRPRARHRSSTPTRFCPRFATGCRRRGGGTTRSTPSSR